MKRKLLPALVLTLLSGTAVAAGYEGSGTSTSNSGSGGMTSGSSSDRRTQSKDASDDDTTMKRSGNKHRSGSMDDKRPMSRSGEHTSMGAHDGYRAQMNIPNEDRVALKTIGINVTPNMPVGDPGRLNPSEQPTTSRQNQEVQADENRELQTILKQAGIHLTPNRPTGAPGMLNSSMSNNSGGNAGPSRENMETKPRTMRAPGIGFNGKITV